MTNEESFERFHRKRRESRAEMQRIREDTDALLTRLEQNAPAALQDIARLEGLRAQRAEAFAAYQAAEDELINALLASLRSSREGSA